MLNFGTPLSKKESITKTFYHPAGIIGVAKLLPDGTYYGSVSMLNQDVITFHGPEDTIEFEFQLSVSNYLNWPWNK